MVYDIKMRWYLLIYSKEENRVNNISLQKAKTVRKGKKKKKKKRKQRP